MKTSAKVRVKKPRRGRPPQDAEGPNVRQRLLDAAAEVYGSNGYHKTTVEMILAAANVSRPTYYKLFGNGHAAIAEVLKRANDDLRVRVLKKVMAAADGIAKIEAAVDAYLDWGFAHGPLATRLYQEIGDLRSPASKERERILGEFTALFVSQTKTLKRPALDPLIYDVLLHVVEHMGSTLFLPGAPAKSVERERRRKIILRVISASLATEPEDFALVVSKQKI